MPPLRIILIDDHALFRSGLRMILQMQWEEKPTLYECGSAEEALALEITPHLVLIDLTLDGIDGFGGIPLIRQKWPQAHVAVVSGDTREESVKTALELGAVGFLPKTAEPAVVIATLRKLMSTTLNASASLKSQGEAVNKLGSLSERQVQILELIAQGLSNRAIGKQLMLAENTIRWYVQGLLEHLGASSRTEAVFLARQLGLIR